MPTRKPVETELPYVLRRADGSIRAELMLTPTEAEKINLNRIKKGHVDDRWVHDPSRKPWSELDWLYGRASGQQQERSASQVLFLPLLPPSTQL